MEIAMSIFHSHTVCSLPPVFLALLIYNLVRAQVAVRQHQVTLTKLYDPLLACEPPPPSESAPNSAVNVSLHRLGQLLEVAVPAL
jgi:hypothetical protein